MFVARFLFFFLLLSLSSSPSSSFYFWILLWWYDNWTDCEVIMYTFRNTTWMCEHFEKLKKIFLTHIFLKWTESARVCAQTFFQVTFTKKNCNGSQLSSILHHMLTHAFRSFASVDLFQLVHVLIWVLLLLFRSSLSTNYYIWLWCQPFINSEYKCAQHAVVVSAMNKSQN